MGGNVLSCVCVCEGTGRAVLSMGCGRDVFYGRRGGEVGYVRVVRQGFGSAGSCVSGEGRGVNEGENCCASRKKRREGGNTKGVGNDSANEHLQRSPTV